MSRRRDPGPQPIVAVEFAATLMSVAVEFAATLMSVAVRPPRGLHRRRVAARLLELS